MSRQQSVLGNTVGYMLNNIDNQATDGEEKSKPEVIKLGLDLHARQVTECRQLDGSTPKPAQQWDPWKLLDKVEEWVKAGVPRRGFSWERGRFSGALFGWNWRVGYGVI